MARTEKVTDTSWRQLLASRKSFGTLSSNREVAKYCCFVDYKYDLEPRLWPLRIYIEGDPDVEFVDEFKITSGLEIQLPKCIQDSLLKKVSSSANSYIVVEVLDIGMDSGKADNSESLPNDMRTFTNILRRRGQSKFRNKLLKAYDKKCAITGCRTEAALEAAHIIPHSQEQSYNVNRGLLLRADIHTLFDLHLISINPGTHTVVMTPSCQVSYGEFSGKKLNLPKSAAERPETGALTEHYNEWLRLNRR